MKLAAQTHSLKLTHEWTISSATGPTASRNTWDIVIVQLSTPDGRNGVGEAAPSSRYAESADSVHSFLAGMDPRRLTFDDVPASMAYLETVAAGNYAAKCALNIALVDGAAKTAGQPVYDWLGLGFREQRHLTSFTIGIDKPEVIRAKVAAASEFPVLKLKVGTLDDRANFAALRAAAPTKLVRVDANEGWQTKEEALRNIEWLAADGYVQFVEQPLPETSTASDFSWLRERSPLPIFGDESYRHASDAERCAECFHGVNVKLVKTGGISGAFAALQAARARGLKTMIGCMIESSVLITAAAHLAELADHLDIDGNLLISNDPYRGASAAQGILSFASAPGATGLRVAAQ